MLNKLELMDRITQGVYIIGTEMKDSYNFMTAAWITQVSFSPCRVVVSVDKSHYSADLMKERKRFTISVLAKGQEKIAKVCGFQSGKTVDKSEKVDYVLNEDGLPVLKDCAAFLGCKVTGIFDVGDHLLFLAEIESGEIGDDEPMVYVSSVYFG